MVVRSAAIPFRGTERFELLRELGAGGMGVVYEALDRERNTRVALKTLNSTRGHAVARFKREFRLLADVHHPNLVRLGELFAEGEHWFFTMELVEGVDFLAHVRGETASAARGDRGSFVSHDEHDEHDESRESASSPSAPCDEFRLRSALSQLACGLAALHASGSVHRDVKPSNVLVTPDGRVVLLDFGLITQPANNNSTEHGLAGTVAYMAPEQAAEQAVGPAADWYAVGTILYEALTGRPPFVGASVALLLNKARYEPAAPRSLLRDVPPDLDALCVDLLRTNPKDRPSERQILDRLGMGQSDGAEHSTSHISTASSLVRGTNFVGREQELSTLEQAFRDCQNGSSVTVFIRGESGMGKSSLMRCFTEKLQATDQDVIVLTGRCFERESVAYKAFDGIMDMLGRHLSRIDPAITKSVLSDAEALVRLFPSLRRVPLLGRSPELRLPDPFELRRRAFEALRTLLQRLSRRCPLVLCIDDFQWTDADSLTLLCDLLRPPDAPPLLLLCTVQTGTAADPATSVATKLGDVRQIQLDRLSREAAEELALQLAGSAAGANATAMVDEAQGHPMFIHELVRHALMTGHHEGLRLDHILQARIQKLEEPARRLLETLAVAGAPLAQETAELAAELDGSTFSRLLMLLRVAHLVRSTGVHKKDTVELYHSRVRQAVLAQLSTEVVRAGHARLASALEATDAARSNPMELVWHFEAAGDVERAAVHARRAARFAVEGLAFIRAAELYGTALRLGTYDETGTRLLLVELGDALASGGRGRQAAEAYQRAAATANATEALALNRRAALQLLVSGHVTEGMALIEQVLAHVGMTIAQSPRAALLSIAWRRLQLRVRGLGYRRKAEHELSAEDLTKIDTCWAIAMGLGNVDPFRAMDFQLRHNQLALRAGEPYRVARALCVETCLSACDGTRGHARTQKLLTAAKSLASETNHPDAVFMAALTEQLVATQEGRWKDAWACTLQTDQVIRERTPGTFEHNSQQLFASVVLFYRGELAELDRRVMSNIRAADERGDLYLAITMRTLQSSVIWLTRDDPEFSRGQISEVLGRCAPEWRLVHAFGDLMAQAYLDLYSAPTARLAWERIAQGWAGLQSSMLLRLQLVRIQMLELRARSALAAAAGTEGSERAGFLRAAEADASRIEREKAPWAYPLVLLTRAGIAHLEQDRAVALELLERAARGFDAAEMALFSAVARRRRGELLGTSEGCDLIDAASSWMNVQTVKNHARMTAMLTPAFAR